MNHRSAPRLIDLQRRMYSSLNEKDSKISIPDKWGTDDGAITLLVAENEENEARIISNHIVEQIKLGIAPNELCIICKQKPQEYTSTIIKELSEHGRVCGRAEETRLCL